MSGVVITATAAASVVAALFALVITASVGLTVLTEDVDLSLDKKLTWDQ